MYDTEMILAKLQDLEYQISRIQQVPLEQPPEIITSVELAKRLAISLPTLRKMRESKKIPSISVGGDFRFNFPKVLEALQKSKSK